MGEFADRFMFLLFICHGACALSENSAEEGHDDASDLNVIDFRVRSRCRIKAVIVACGFPSVVGDGVAYRDCRAMPRPAVQRAAANLVVDSFFAAFVLADKRRTVVENSLARLGSISQSGIELSLVSSPPLDDELQSQSLGSPRGNAIDAHYTPDKHAIIKKVYASRLRRLRMPRVRPASASASMTNIEWPLSREFDSDVGRTKIIEFIEKTWDYGSALRYSVEQLYSAQLTSSKRYKYRVCWVWLSDRMSSNRESIINTASIYFNVDVSIFENQSVDVSYTFQSHKRLHRPGRSKFHEKWLDDLVSGRLLVSTA